MRRLLQYLLPAAVAVWWSSCPAAGVDLSGYWLLDTARSEQWPAAATLTPAAAERFKTFDPTTRDPVRVCMPFGMPRVMTALAAQPMEIVQTDAQVTLLFDSHDEVRRIFIGNGKPEEDRVPSWLGYSSGRWERDTLIVGTSHVMEATLVTEAGIPHGPALTITERIALLENGRTLRIEMTLTDPASFTRPVTRTLYYQAIAETQPREFTCSEQLWLDHVTRRAKELTREMARAKKQP